MPFVRPRTAALALLAAAAGPAVADDPGELLKYVPQPVNTVAVVNVAGILRSPRAQKEGWAKLPHTEYLAGAVPINPSVERLLLATQFVPAHPAYGGGLAVAQMAGPIDADKLAKVMGATTDTLGGEKVVVASADRFFAPLAPRTLGVLRTNARQDVGRWVRYAKTAERSNQSGYLNRSVFNFGTKFHVLVAADTEDLFHPAQLRTAVGESKVMQADPKTAAAVEKFIAGMNGVRFTADILEAGIAATIRVDSTVRADGLPADVVKGFVIETLAKNGAELIDLGAATARAEGLTVVLSFMVSDGELAKIMSLFVTAAGDINDADTIPVAPAGPTSSGTRTYVRAVDRILTDLGGKNETGKRYDDAAVWYDTAANRVATLNVLNADPDAVAFGREVAGRLQAMAGSLRGVPLKVDALDSQAYAYQFGGGFGFFGGGRSVDTNLPQIDQAVREVIVKDRANRDKMWAKIGTERTQLQGKLEGKYSAGFDGR